MTVSRPLGILSAVIALLLALLTQGTWEDKSFYLASRAPVSAACLRAWKTAPPACRDRVFQWGNPSPGELGWLGLSLEKRSLSVFGPRQTYLLQGDIPLGRVRFEPAPTLSFFTRDGKVPGHIEDFHRLDLALSPGAAVTWHVDIPPDTRTAHFRAVVRTEPDESSSARGATVSAAAGPDGPIIASRVFLPRGETRELTLDLSRLAGRAVRLSLGAEETQTPGGLLLWEAPRIELKLERS